jgi:hypothetical protein
MGLSRRSLLAAIVIIIACPGATVGAPTQLLFGPDRPEPLPTRWISPDGTPKPAHAAQLESRPLLIEAQGLPPQSLAAPGVGASNGRIALIVHNSIFDAVHQAVTEFTWDLAAAGWSTTIYRFTSGSAPSLRSYLYSLYTSGEGLKGAILIGDIPYIIYEMMQSWDGGATWEYDDFPCDIFYMDLNGTWSDSLTDRSVQPNNGKYDTRSGDLALEIWVGRIKTSNLPSLGNETGLITSYLLKNRAFRSTPLVTARYALAYDDDDWGYMATGDRQALELVFGAGYCVGVGDAETTTAADYKNNRLPQSTRWHLVRSHGYPGGHGFYRNSKAAFDWVYSSDYRNIDPPGSFYSLFVCSGCDYTSSNYLGGTVAFNPQSSGIFAVGSTKTGGMYADSYFFSPMSQGHCVGESFRRWFNQVQTLYGPSCPRWWYGMTLLGDPSLHPNPSSYPVYRNLTIIASPPGGGTIVPSEGNHSYPAGQVVPITATPASGYRFERWDGPVANPLLPSTTVTLTADTSISARFAAITIAEAKLQADNTPIALASKTVTCSDWNSFYIEEESRVSGIRVEKPGHGLGRGMRANVIGTLCTNSDGERYISATSASSTGSGSIRPIYLNINNIGGSNWLFDPATGAGQKAVVGGCGLNNIGLLVTAFGRAEAIGPASFTLRYGWESIKVIVPAGVDMPPAGVPISVTGVVSVEASGGETRPVLRVGTPSDIAQF